MCELHGARLLYLRSIIITNDAAGEVMADPTNK